MEAPPGIQKGVLKGQEALKWGESEAEVLLRCPAVEVSAAPSAGSSAKPNYQGHFTYTLLSGM